jgi:glycosyltransferase involved in cell wall biosynthesis
VGGKKVLLTFGLLSPNKGIEHVLNALPDIVAEFPDVVYIVLGATHPHELRDARRSLPPRASKQSPPGTNNSRTTSSSRTALWS